MDNFCTCHQFGAMGCWADSRTSPEETAAFQLGAIGAERPGPWVSWTAREEEKFLMGQAFRTGKAPRALAGRVA